MGNLAVVGDRPCPGSPNTDGRDHARARLGDCRFRHGNDGLSEGMRIGAHVKGTLHSVISPDWKVFCITHDQLRIPRGVLERKRAELLAILDRRDLIAVERVPDAFDLIQLNADPEFAIETLQRRMPGKS